MTAHKTVKIPETLFLELLKYHLLDAKTPERETYIRHALQTKWDTVSARLEYAKNIRHNTP